MINIAEELDKNFHLFISEKNPDAFYRGLVSYLRFIEDTVPLSLIAHKLLFPRPKFMVFGHLGNFYKVAVLHDKQAEVFPITPEGLEGSGLYLFHSTIKSEAAKMGIVHRQIVILHVSKDSQRICLQTEPIRCYSLKRENPQRFQIVLMLLKTETGKSAREIANALNKDGSDKIIQDNVKKEIDKINELFMAHTQVDDELISTVKAGGKNIYFLNKECFDFVKEK